VTPLETVSRYFARYLAPQKRKNDPNGQTYVVGKVAWCSSVWRSTII